MEKTYFANTARNILILEQAKEVAFLLNHEGIKPMFLKGLASVLSLYSNSIEFGMRPISDIDILVRKSEVNKVFNALISKGYVLSNCGDLVFIKAKGYVVPVDVHDFLWYANGGEEEIFSRAVENELDGAKFYLPSLSDLFVSTLAHYSIQSCLSHKAGIFDILILLQEKLDWNFIIKLIRNYKIEGGARFTLEEIKNKFNVYIPDFVFEYLGDSNFIKKALFIYVQRKDVSEKMRFLLDFRLLGSHFPSANYLRFHQSWRGKTPIIYLLKFFGLFYKSLQFVCGAP